MLLTQENSFMINVLSLSPDLTLCGCMRTSALVSLSAQHVSTIELKPNIMQAWCIWYEKLAVNIEDSKPCDSEITLMSAPSLFKM